MNYRKARFHIETGPDTLFTRVHQKMAGHRMLQLPSRQLQKRWTERQIPVGELRAFHMDDWELMTADVRTDRGKFVSTGWRRPCNGSWLWIVVGMGDLIEKAMFKHGRGVGDDTVTEGELHDFVRDVNQELIDADASWNDSMDDV